MTTRAILVAAFCELAAAGGTVRGVQNSSPQPSGIYATGGYVTPFSGNKNIMWDKTDQIQYQTYPYQSDLGRAGLRDALWARAQQTQPYQSYYQGRAGLREAPFTRGNPFPSRTTGGSQSVRVRAALVDEGPVDHPVLVDALIETGDVIIEPTVSRPRQGAFRKEEYMLTTPTILENQYDFLTKDTKLEVTHKPVYHKQIINRVNQEDVVQKDVYHHMWQAEERPQFVAGKYMTAVDANIDHSKVGGTTVVGSPRAALMSQRGFRSQGLSKGAYDTLPLEEDVVPLTGATILTSPREALLQEATFVPGPRQALIRGVRLMGGRQALLGGHMIRNQAMQGGEFCDSTLNQFCEDGTPCDANILQCIDANSCECPM